MLRNILETDKSCDFNRYIKYNLLHEFLHSHENRRYTGNILMYQEIWYVLIPNYPNRFKSYEGN